MALTHGLTRPHARGGSYTEQRRRSIRIRQFMTVFGAMHFADRLGRPETAPARREKS